MRRGLDVQVKANTVSIGPSIFGDKNRMEETERKMCDELGNRKYEMTYRYQEMTYTSCKLESLNICKYLWSQR